MLKVINFKKSNPYYIFCNKLIKCGLKFSSYSKFLFVFWQLKYHFKKEISELFELIFSLLEVYLNIYHKKIGGNIYPIPLYVNKKIRLRKGLTNLLNVLENKKEKDFLTKLVNELFDIVNMRGSTLNLRNNVYILAINEKSNLRYIRPKFRKLPLNYKKVYAQK